MDFNKVIRDFNNELDIIREENKQRLQLNKRLKFYCSEYNGINKGNYQLQFSTEDKYNNEVWILTDENTVFKVIYFTLDDFINYVINVEESVLAKTPCVNIFSLNDSTVYKHFLDFILLKVKTVS